MSPNLTDLQEGLPPETFRVSVTCGPTGLVAYFHPKDDTNLVNHLKLNEKNSFHVWDSVEKRWDVMFMAPPPIKTRIGDVLYFKHLDVKHAPGMEILNGKLTIPSTSPQKRRGSSTYSASPTPSRKLRLDENSPSAGSGWSSDDPITISDDKDEDIQECVRPVPITTLLILFSDLKADSSPGKYQAGIQTPDLRQPSEMAFALRL